MSTKQQLIEALKKSRDGKKLLTVPTLKEQCEHNLREFRDCWRQKLLDEVNKKGSFPGANIPFSTLGYSCLKQRSQIDLYLKTIDDLDNIICEVHKAFFREILSEELVIKLSFSRQKNMFEIYVILPLI